MYPRPPYHGYGRPTTGLPTLSVAKAYAALWDEQLLEGGRDPLQADRLWVFEPERQEDLMALALEVVFADRSRGPELVEMVEPGHDLGLVGLVGRDEAIPLSSLLASLVFCCSALVALGRDPSLAGTFASPAHFGFPVTLLPLVRLARRALSEICLGSMSR